MRTKNKSKKKRKHLSVSCAGDVMKVVSSSSTDANSQHNSPLFASDDTN